MKIRKAVSMGLAILLGVLFLVFVTQNLDSVDYTFLFWTVTAPAFLIFIIIFLTGALLGWGLFRFRRSKIQKAKQAEDSED